MICEGGVILWSTVVEFSKSKITQHINDVATPHACTHVCMLYVFGYPYLDIYIFNLIY